MRCVCEAQFPVCTCTEGDDHESRFVRRAGHMIYITLGVFVGLPLIGILFVGVMLVSLR